MRLNETYFGTDDPGCLVLHGLLGSSRNWTAAAKDLAPAFGGCLALDLRNHGASPHAPGMSIPLMAADVEETLEDLGVGPILLMGHSLGGKVAMRLAVDHPERVSGLVVADIAPRAYPPHFESVVDLLRSVRIENYPTRKAVDAVLEKAVPDWGFRQFLLTNLEREPGTERFRWKPNLEAIHEHRDRLALSPLGEAEAYPGPTLFLRGGRSTFIRASDPAGIHHHFPAAVIETIADAGHNVHVDARETFVRAIIEWHRKEVLKTSIAPVYS